MEILALLAIGSIAIGSGNASFAFVMGVLCGIGVTLMAAQDFLRKKK